MKSSKWSVVWSFVIILFSLWAAVDWYLSEQACDDATCPPPSHTTLLRGICVCVAEVKP